MFGCLFVLYVFCVWINNLKIFCLWCLVFWMGDLVERGSIWLKCDDIFMVILLR